MTSQRGSHKALLGRKLGMTQVWDENGFFVPVTLVDVSTNVVRPSSPRRPMATRPSRSVTARLIPPR